MRIALLDYGAGNLHSLSKALARPGITVRVESDIPVALESDVLVLPGVGAFGPASAALSPHRDAVHAAVTSGLPLLGVCLGMQLLFDESAEAPGAGLGLINGKVERFNEARVPQIGWNNVRNHRDTALARAGLTTAYYANSFFCRPAELTTATAWSTYGDTRFAAVVRAGRVVGVQFHPEKSSTVGVAFLGAVIDELAP
jgi:glutamine amidotransferase